jgi:hypothetical protein
MEGNIAISYFNNETETDFKKSLEKGINILGNNKKIKMITNGTQLLLVNKQTNSVIGVAISCGECITPHLMDQRNVYNDNKYNKYEIPLKRIFMFKNPLPIKALIDMFQIPNVRSNITNSQFGMNKIYIKCENEAEIIKNISEWMYTYI